MKIIKKGATCPFDGYILKKEEYFKLKRDEQILDEVETQLMGALK